MTTHVDDSTTRGQHTEQGDETRLRILEAATAQFKEKGLAGARVELIARAAGCNKQLIYYYFGDKASLYEESLKRMVRAAHAHQADIDESRHGAGFVLQLLRDYANNAKDADLDWARLWLWEAITWPQDAITLEDERRVTWRRAIRQVRRAQAAGHVRADLDPAMVLLAILSLGSFAHIFPQLTELICGRGPDDPRWLRQEDKFFQTVSSLFAPPDEL